MIFYMNDCEDVIGYSFKNKDLLRLCFTHSSYSHEHGSSLSNERLEFFGDAVLELIVSEFLYKKYPKADEGKLTEYRQMIVSRKPLSDAIIRLGLTEYVLYGEGERHNTDERREKMNSNLFESIVAGLYIDGGISEAEKFIKNNLLNKIKLSTAESKRTEKKEDVVIDYKSRLQEYTQSKKLGVPTYKVKEMSGPPHDPVFKVAVEIAGKEMGIGEGKKKSDAGKSAAKIAYDKLIGTSEPTAQKSKPNTDRKDTKKSKTTGKEERQSSPNKNPRQFHKSATISAKNAEKPTKQGKQNQRRKIK